MESENGDIENGDMEIWSQRMEILRIEIRRYERRIGEIIWTREYSSTIILIISYR